MNNSTNLSYEHHLEKWLDNTSKMNSEYNNYDGNWPILNAPNAFHQQSSSRKYNSHLQPYGSIDPFSVPSQSVSFKIQFDISQTLFEINFDWYLLNFLKFSFIDRFRSWNLVTEYFGLHKFQQFIQTAISTLTAKTKVAISNKQRPTCINEHATRLPKFTIDEPNKK